MSQYENEGGVHRIGREGQGGWSEEEVERRQLPYVVELQIGGIQVQGVRGLRERWPFEAKRSRKRVEGSEMSGPG